MLDSFKAALARVQSDYEFFIGCQTDPTSTLTGYDLSPEERSALTDPVELARMLEEDLGPPNNPSITVEISGGQNWINPELHNFRSGRDASKEKTPQERFVDEAAAVKAASSDEERSQAALKLIERIG